MRRGLSFLVLIGLFLSSLLAAGVPADLEEETKALFSGSLGYTLVGEKAIAIEELFASRFRKKYNEQLTPIMVVKYLKDTFSQSGKFAFITTGNEEYQKIYLIHKEALERRLKEDRAFLNHRLKRKVTVDWIIETLQQKRYLLDAVSLGVLLGYGKENSLFYARRTELGQYLGKSPVTQLCLFEQPSFLPPMIYSIVKSSPPVTHTLIHTRKNGSGFRKI